LFVKCFSIQSIINFEFVIMAVTSEAYTNTNRSMDILV